KLHCSLHGETPVLHPWNVDLRSGDSRQRGGRTPVTVGNQNFTVDVKALATSGEVTERSRVPTFVRTRTTEPLVRPPLFLKPSEAEGGSWRVVESVDLGGRLPIDGIADIAALGEALHSIIGYDDPDRDRDKRLADASFRRGPPFRRAAM